MFDLTFSHRLCIDIMPFWKKLKFDIFTCFYRKQVQVNIFPQSMQWYGAKLKKIWCSLLHGFEGEHFLLTFCHRVCNDIAPFWKKYVVGEHIQPHILPHSRQRYGAVRKQYEMRLPCMLLEKMFNPTFYHKSCNDMAPFWKKYVTKNLWNVALVVGEHVGQTFCCKVCNDMVPWQYEMQQF